jgi:hypothetical protein
MESKRARAAEALRSVLTHVSGVKLRNIDVEPSKSEQCVDILAQVQIYGRDHTLACILVSNDQPEHVRESVVGFCNSTAKAGGNTTPVVIASRLSTDLQKVCRETSAGMLDLSGNARIEVGDVFIACQHNARPLTPRNLQRHLPKSVGQSSAVA